HEHGQQVVVQNIVQISRVMEQHTARDFRNVFGGIFKHEAYQQHVESVHTDEQQLIESLFANNHPRHKAADVVGFVAGAEAQQRPTCGVGIGRYTVVANVVGSAQNGRSHFGFKQQFTI